MEPCCARWPGCSNHRVVIQGMPGGEKPFRTRDDQGHKGT
jgi:hypothetical protein